MRSSAKVYWATPATAKPGWLGHGARVFQKKQDAQDWAKRWGWEVVER